MQFTSSRSARRRGAVAPLVALLLIFLLGMVAFAVDIGWIVLTESELKNAADSAALAGVKPLMDGYVQYNLPGLTAAQQSAILTAAQNNAIANAQAYASYHTAGGVSNLTLNSGDIQFGFTTASGIIDQLHRFSQHHQGDDAPRDSSANGALTLFCGPGDGSEERQHHGLGRSNHVRRHGQFLADDAYRQCKYVALDL